MTEQPAPDRGRERFDREAWGDAYALLSEADRTGGLDAEDLERLAVSAHLLGRSAESLDARERAHHGFLARGQAGPAVRCAARLAVDLVLRGETARGGGWIARAQRILEDLPAECVEQGYVLMAVALRSLFAGDPSSAQVGFARAAALAQRSGDRDLTALARHAEGRAWIMLGDTARGVALLDEAMVAVVAGEVSSTVVGDIYCSVIEACYEIFDLRRAHEWTEALSHWCDTQSDRVPYRGNCLIRRAEILQHRGAWHDAMEEARRAREWLAQPPVQRSVGAALYQLGELYRLRGELSRAEESYRQAHDWGREPEPGLALLRLAQGQAEGARTMIRRALDEAGDPRARARLLGPAVEIELAGGDIAAAAAAASELAGIASRLGAPLLRALSAGCAGAVLLARDEPHAALAELRAAWKAWRDLEAPYEAARVRVLLAVACRALGDQDSAQLELGAARRVFRELGAAPDLARVEALSGRRQPGSEGRLTAREVQVLALIAAGRSNRAIAEELAISEKTAARHVSNILSKLGLGSRSAATAYAYQHGLVQART